MEKITSRKNKIITDLRLLAADGGYRRDQALYVCDGEKLLRDAIAAGARIDAILTGHELPPELTASQARVYLAPPELLQYASPLKNTAGPVFTVAMPMRDVVDITRGTAVIAIENLQDPGNVGTILRSANALGVDLAVLVGDCADPYGPKAVRASMGAIFRQRIAFMTATELSVSLRRAGIPLFGATLSPRSRDIREVSLSGAAVAIGSEGAGLSAAVLSVCDGEITIPMRAGAESLNAASAAAIAIWQLMSYN